MGSNPIIGTLRNAILRGEIVRIRRLATILANYFSVTSKKSIDGGATAGRLSKIFGNFATVFTLSIQTMPSARAALTPGLITPSAIID